MGDDEKKGDDGKSADGSHDDAAIPEVEAEIVGDPAAAQGDLLTEEAGERDAASDGETRDETAQVAPPDKPKTPGVAIFAVFAAGALAVFGYWLWQARDSGSAAAATSSASAPAQPWTEEAGAVADDAGAAAGEAIASARDAEEAAADVVTDPSTDLSAERAEGAADAIVEVEDGNAGDLALDANSSESQDAAEETSEAPAQVASEEAAPDAALTDDLAQTETDEGALSEGEESFVDNATLNEDEEPTDAASNAAADNAFADAGENAAASGEETASFETEAVESAVDDAIEEPAVASSGDATDAPSDNDDLMVRNDAAQAAAQAAYDREVAALRQGFTGEIEQLTASLGAEREKNAALEAEMAAMRASFDETLRTREASADSAISSLRVELATAQRALEVSPEEAGAAAEALARLADAVDTGRAFTSELEAVADFTADEAVLAPLQRRAAEGAPTRRELKAGFADAARAALAAADQGEAKGFWGNLSARAQNIVSVRPSSPQQGGSPRAVMSRIEDAVRRDAYGPALSQLAELPQPAQAALQDWATQARAYEEVRTALIDLNGAVLAQAAR